MSKWIVLALLCLFPGLALGGTLLKTKNAIEGSYIVVLNDVPLATMSKEGRVERIRELAQELSTRHEGVVEHLYTNTIDGFSVSMAPEQAANLAKEKGVSYVEEVTVVSIMETQAHAVWGLDRIDQRALPLNSLYNYSGNGAGVTAYIVDTGLRTTHQEFGGRAVHGFSAIRDGRGGVDCNGHGSHVAGTVGGKLYGVAKGVKLVGVRVLGCSGSGDSAGVVAGLDWVAKNANLPAVANMSLGGGISVAIDHAVRAAVSSGVVFVVAAGNESADACQVSPARVKEAITVGATNKRDARAYYSNYGTCVDIFAPGDAITSAAISSDIASATMSGTSMAAPHVAGAVALYLQGHPLEKPAAVSDGLKKNATKGKVTGAGAGSPNILIYTGPVSRASVLDAE